LFGKHKLGEVSPAAGNASPNKTIEGALAGFFGCVLISLYSGRKMNWQLWQLSGLLYGSGLFILALLGDLTTSVMKRDANLKDSGSLLPGHGGFMDRLDSYLFTAPFAYFFVTKILPLFPQR
jgi:phosphatidate cytidylyltransferase